MKLLIAFISSAAMAVIASSAASAATVTLSTSLGPIGGASVENFNELGLGAVSSPTTLTGLDNATLTTSGAPTPAIVQGNNATVNIAPFPTGGVDTSNYLSVFGGSSATFTLSHAANYLGLLWGSVDAYNTITFLDGSNNVLNTFTGTDFVTHNGNQGAAGTFYANFVSSVPFLKVVLSSTANSFEVDDVAVSTVPLPAALPLFGAALIGMGVFGRKRRKTGGLVA